MDLLSLFRFEQTAVSCDGTRRLLQSDNRGSLRKRGKARGSLGTGLRWPACQLDANDDGLLESQCMNRRSAHGFRFHANPRQDTCFERQVSVR